MAGVLDTIVAASRAAEKTRVRVPEWECDLYFGKVTAADRVRIRKGLKPDQVEALYVSSIQHCATDKDGKRIFELDPKTRDQLMAHADMGVIMRILREASIEQDPRSQMLEDASLDDLRGLLTSLGDAPPGEMSDLSDDMLDAIRAVAMAKEWEVAEALGVDPGAAPDPVTTAKNA
jgi:hypothetical protein